MRLLRLLIADDSGQASYEYAMVFLVFAVAAIFGIDAMINVSGHALQYTRARSMCMSVTMRPTVQTSVDSAGNVTCS